MNKENFPSFRTQKEYYDKRRRTYLLGKGRQVFIRRLLGYGIEKKCIKQFVISRMKSLKATRPKEYTLQIVDLGCGTGWLTKILSEYGDVIGMDLSVETARNLYPDIRFKQADIITEEIEGEYDIAISTEVLEHLTSENQKIYIKKASDILKEGGYLILTTPNKRSDTDEKLRKKYCKSPQPIENWIDKESLIALLAEHNFKIEFIGSCLFCPIFIKKRVLLEYAYKYVYDLPYKLIFKRLESSNRGLKLIVVAQKPAA